MISIIMTSYNKPKYIGKSIEGILNQSYKNFELLLMDDNSDIETQKVIQSYLSDKRIKLYRSNIQTIEQRVEKNRYAAQINHALTFASGKYISYATDDNVYRRDRLIKMLSILESSPEINIVYSGSRIIYLNNDGTSMKTVERHARAQTWLAPCQVDHCCVMHRTNILQTIYDRWGSFWDEDPEYYIIGDARFFWRLNHFWPFHPINEILDDNYITEISLHKQITLGEKSAFILQLPKQRTCRELRGFLKSLRGANT